LCSLFKNKSPTMCLPYLSRVLVLDTLSSCIVDRRLSLNTCDNTPPFNYGTVQTFKILFCLFYSLYDNCINVIGICISLMHSYLTNSRANSNQLKTKFDCRLEPHRTTGTPQRRSCHGGQMHAFCWIACRLHACHIN
jgi:hypothetical protein